MFHSLYNNFLQFESFDLIKSKLFIGKIINNKDMKTPGN